MAGWATTGSRHARATGFSVLELLVAAAISIVATSLVLTAVEMNLRVSRLQVDVAGVQQAVRVAQHEMAGRVRVAGRGGLAKAQAVAVEQDVAAGTTLGGSPVVAETDILTLRGVLDGPIFRVDADDAATFLRGGDTVEIVVASRTGSGYEQPLDTLHDLVDAAAGSLRAPEAVLVVGRQGASVVAVAELAGIEFEERMVDILNVPTLVERAALTLNVEPAVGTHTGDYLALAGGAFPAGLEAVALVAIVEEVRYFIRQDTAIRDDPASSPSPKLSRARMLPGTDREHPAGPGFVDIADDIFDLQVSLGVDVDGDGRVESEDDDGEPLGAEADEWLWNHPVEDAIGTRYPGLSDARWEDPPLHHVRLSVLGRTRSPDRGYVSPAIAAIENRVYDQADIVSGAELDGRRYRYRLLQSTVALRNLR